MASFISDFRLWVSRMGFNQRQVTVAADLIGIGTSKTASLTYTGRRELTQTERLAMSAVRLGLKPWTPGYDDELQAMAPVASTPANAA